MPDSLRDLEAGRAKLFQQMQTLDDSVRVPLAWWSDAAASPPVIAPNQTMRAMTRSSVSLGKADGKTVTESFSTPAPSAKPNEKSRSSIGSRPLVRT